MSAPRKSGDIALVTGATSDLGHAIARALAADGWSLVLTGRDDARGAPLAGELAARWMPGDLGDAGFCDALARSARLTGFVHAAAHRFRYQRFHLVDPATAAAARAVDHDAAVALLRHVLPEMMAARFGRIVLVTSLAAAAGSVGAAQYACDKAALEALARTLALEYGRFGITANAVQPGFIATSRLAQRTHEGTLSPEDLAARTALKRLADPPEVAAAVAFLMSARASYITGTTLAVTGGLHLNTLW